MDWDVVVNPDFSNNVRVFVLRNVSMSIWNNFLWKYDGVN